MALLRRRRSPSLESFLAPEDLSDVALVQTLAEISSNMISSYSSGNNSSLKFQRKNSRSLIRKIQGFLVLLEYLRDSCTSSNSPPSVVLPWTAILCCKEFYLLLYRSKILLDYCNQSSKLWLLLQNQTVSGHFRDLNQEVLTLLDVFPFEEVEFCEDLREHIELMKKQSKRLRFYIDKGDEDMRATFFSFLHEFENGRIPGKADLELFFYEKMGICNAKSCRAEIEFLEEQVSNQEGDVEPTTSVLNGFVAIVRYCRFLLFGFEEDEVELCDMGNHRKAKKGLITQENAETFLTIPKDFCCPISLDLMRDPVIVSTGQTYDRSSISRWIEEGHCSCPKSGQMLVHTRLVPNQALRNLIMQWCTAHGFQSDPPESTDSAEAFSAVSPTKAAIEANSATTLLLIQRLTSRSEAAKTIAARELRYLAKTGKENRAYIAQAGAIPHLHKLLASSNAIAQENSVTAMLNLSIYDKNKCRIIDEQGCLGSIVDVLRNGHTTEAKENAAATLFSLSAVHDYKKIIADEEGAVEALGKLLKNGTRRGRRDAVTALFNLSTHIDNFAVLIESGGVKALVEALGTEGVSEEAAGALALIVRQPNGAKAVGDEEIAVPGLIAMMRCGSPRGKENAVATLLELCRIGGATATQRVVKAPALAGLLQSLLFTGTKRARRKAASLARVFQRSEIASLHYGGLGVGYAFASNAAPTRDSSFANDHLSVPMSMSVSVSVL